MSTFLNKTLLTLLFALFGITFINGQAAFILPTDKEFIDIPMESLRIYEDNSGDYSFESVSHPAFQERFKPLRDNNAFIPFSEYAYWVTFKLKGSALSQKKWILEIPTNTVQNIDFYIVESNGKVAPFKVGAHRPMSNKMVQHKNYLFDLPLHQEEIQIYARYKTKARTPFIFWLKTNSYLLSNSNKEYILLGIFYGILFIMGIYNLLLFLVTDEKISLYFTLYVFSSCMLTTVTDGLGFQYLWPNFPFLNSILYKIAPHIYIGSLILYGAAFLNLRQTQKRFFAIILAVSISILVLNLVYEKVNDSTSVFSYLVSMLLLYIASIASVKKGFKPARLLLLGQTFTLIGIGIVFFRKLGMVDYSMLGDFQLALVVYILNIALIIEVVLFSIAQTNKIKFRQMEREQKLVASEKRFRNIFESCFDAILVFDTDTKRIIDANESAVHLFQKDKSKLAQASIEQLIDFNPATSNKNKAYPLSRKFLGNQGKFEFETTGLKTNGEKIDCEVSLSLMEKEKQELIAITINDSSERKKAERTLKSKMLEISQKNEELRRYIASNSELESFAYVVSHDMKQPLRTINSFSMLLNKHLEKKKLLDEESKQYMNFINNGIDNIQTLIKDLLKHAQIIAVGNLEFEPHDLNELIQIVQLNLNRQINKNKVQLNIQPLPENLAICKVKINQLFQNLISNAIKFRQRDRTCIINIRVMEKPSFWEFQIQDNGIGIAPKYQDAIFQLFKKLHTQKEYKGSGVGLTTCKKIVELHGGSIWVQSEEGVGTTFFFTIQKGLNTKTTLPFKIAEAN